ncbi:hypothetical protein, partial [Mycolicibacterium llatzerense]|uniref:hypothetical protein n=1 Tax=Mycolicibacterium llatzerense TaxID=280871 RepID=UPI0013A6DB80
MSTATIEQPDDVMGLEPENLPDPSPTPVDETGLSEIKLNNVDIINRPLRQLSHHQDGDYHDESPLVMGNG